MELVFRKYFWAVYLVFLLAAAYLAASGVNLLVESALVVPPKAQATRQVMHPTTIALPPVWNLSRFAALLGLPLPPVEPAVKEPQVPAFDPNAAPVKSGLRVRLLGTLLSSIPGWSIASIQDTVTQKSQTYMVGDRIQGAEVLEIERTRVIILNNNRREYINNEPGDGAMPQAGAPQVHPAQSDLREPGTQVTGAGIRALSENDYEVPRKEIDNTLANLNDVAMQARIVPAFKDGVAFGFKLFSIRPDSIYTKIGIQNGDVIKRINGYDLNSPEKALEVYSKLKEASRIDLEVDRNGVTVRKTYTIH